MLLHSFVSYLVAFHFIDPWTVPLLRDTELRGELASTLFSVFHLHITRHITTLFSVLVRFLSMERGLQWPVAE